MKRAWTIILCALLLAGLLSGCGGSAYKSSAASTYPMTNNAGDYAAREDYEPGEGWYATETTASNASGALMSGQVPANVKLIFTANITLESTEFDAAAEALTALTADCGGWYESSRLDNYSRYRSASYTVRVPAERFEDFCARIGESATLRSISRGSEDVSERYYDVESRLATQRTKLERLQTLLAQAEEMEDIITLESAISETELAIESLTGSLRHYDSLVGYSTIYVTLNEVYKVTETETAPIGFGQRLSAAFREGTEGFVDGFQDFLVDLASVWLGLLVFLAIVALVVFFIVRGRRKRRAAGYVPRERKQRRAKRGKKAAQQPEAPQPIPQPTDAQRQDQKDGEG